MKLTGKKIIKCFLPVLACLFFSLYTQAQTSKPVRLQCEYLSDPIGIDAPNPRLLWQLEDGRPGARQRAYQLLVGTDSLQLSKGKGNSWQTPKTASSASMVTYKGKSLQAFTKYFWKITTWDKDDRKGASATGSFETGMMEKKNWQGFWISDDKSISVKPAPYFRKNFVTAKAIASARIYIAVAGLYELSLNGQKVGNHRLDPMYTRFDRRTLYVTYDVTSQLQNGDNTIGVLLGNGWYNHQSTAVWDFHRAAWRGRPAFCLDLRITYTDSTTETIASNTEWKTSLSPVVFNSIYTAEQYDARKEQPGWDTPAFADTAWQNAMNRPAPSNNIVAQAMQPIRDVEEIAVQKFTRFSDTAYLFDLGRNISGVSRIKVKGAAGTTIRLTHAERLYKNGRVDLSNINVHYRPTDDTDPFQTDIFTLSGKGEETFQPRFNYKGFQYVEISSDQPVTLTKESLTGYFMHSDVEPIGTISSSNPTIDKIWKAANNSYLSNLFGYPTDCPQREKNGWTGDAHIAAETGLYSFDAVTIYEKWMADHRDLQQPNGVLPSIIPTSDWGYAWGNGPDWTSTIAIIPWELYLFYGDTKTLADCYDNIKLYVDHINTLYPAGLTTWGLGDWVPVKSVSPVELTSSVYYFTDASILAKAAKLLGKQQDFLKYIALSGKIKNAINKKYLDAGKGIYGQGLQTELSVPLYWGVVPDELKATVAENLAKRVAADNYHLDAGILGTKAILNALSENGYADIAYKIASQETFPSWGWWIVNGATTLYENWNIDAKNDISLNHIMFGDIGAWMYRGIGGIKPNPKEPGFKNVLLEPHFVPGLDQFEASHNGPFGKILSSWKKTGETVMYSVIVPANSNATVVFPDNTKTAYLHGIPIGKVGKGIKPVMQGNRKAYQLQAGSYQFEIR